MRLLILIICVFSVVNLFGQRALYVDGFASILGNPVAEDELLQFSEDRSIRKLLLYQLHLVHNQYDFTDPVENQVFADFVKKAKTQYGIETICAIGETSSSFQNRFLVYNSTRMDDDEKIDCFNLEFEFWVNSATNPGGYYCDTYLQPNGFACDSAGAFDFFTQEMTIIRDLAHASSFPITAEAYVGWPTLNQAQVLPSLVDLLLVHAYVSSPTTAFGYTQSRLTDLSSALDTLNVSIIYSSEPSFMQNWLLQNDLLQAESIYTNDYFSNPFAGNQYIALKDFTYFAYSDLAGVLLDQYAEINSPDGFTSFAAVPNPTDGILVLSFKTMEDANSEIRITDLSGKEVSLFEGTQNNSTKRIISLENLNSGIYVIQCGDLQPRRIAVK